MPKNLTNSKAEAGRARKAEQESLKKQKEAATKEAEIEKEWSKGANQKGASRAEMAAAKADEIARKKAEKAALLAAEEESLGGAKVKKAPALSKGKGKKKKNNDLTLLEDALVGEAEKKRKAKKKAEQLKKEKEEAAAKAKAEKDAAQTMDPLLQNTAAMLGDNHLGRDANKATMELDKSGIDGALQTLTVGGGDVKRQKALYLAFEDRMMSTVKADYPGLRLTQYKEKIFQLWKKSPENPQNQPQK